MLLTIIRLEQLVNADIHARILILSFSLFHFECEDSRKVPISCVNLYAFPVSRKSCALNLRQLEEPIKNGNTPPHRSCIRVHARVHVCVRYVSVRVLATLLVKFYIATRISSRDPRLTNSGYSLQISSIWPRRSVNVDLWTFARDISKWIDFAQYQADILFFQFFYGRYFVNKHSY